MKTLGIFGSCSNLLTSSGEVNSTSTDFLAKVKASFRPLSLAKPNIP